jgi:drug/metabolite transporter (DMT)-like permease
MILASLLFAAMAMLAKLAAGRLPGPEVAFVRFAVGLAACGAASLRRPLQASNWRGLFWRGAFGGSAVLCYFLAIEHLTVGVATLLNYTAPVFTALWAATFLGERLSRASAGALALTVVGVALVIHATAPAGTFGLGRWQLVGVASSMLSGAAIATIREVRRTDGSWEIFCAFCVGGALLTCVPAARAWVAPTGGEWVMLAGVGAIAVAAQLLMTYSLRFLPAALGGIIMQLTPAAALALDWLLYGQRAGGVAVVGAALTFVGASWGARLSMQP